MPLRNMEVRVWCAVSDQNNRTHLNQVSKKTFGKASKTHTHTHTHTSDDLKDTGIQYQKFLTVINNMLTKCQARLIIL